MASSLAATRLVVLCVAGALAGCHGIEHRHDRHFFRHSIHVPHPHGKHSCKGQGNCNVAIKFACDPPATSPPKPDKCEVYADPEIIAVDNVQRVTFMLDPNTADFEADGIVFTSPYFRCARGENPRRFVCDVTIPDRTPLDFYKYSIHVTGFDVVDPWVVNY